MTIFEAMLRRIQEDVVLSGYVGSQIYPGYAPEKTKPPYIVWLLVSSTSEYAHDGETRREYTIQFSVFTDKLITALAISDRLTALFSGRRQTLSTFNDVVSMHAGTRSTFEPATKLHHVSVDFTFSLPAPPDIIAPPPEPQFFMV